MSDTLLRQWAMLMLIPPAPRKCSTSELRRLLEEDGFPVDIRSLQRDLNTLSTRFPLQNDTRNKPYGWSWRKDARPLSIPGMSPSTALALKLANAMLDPVLPRSTLRSLAPQLANADHVLGSLSNTALREWTRKVRIIPDGMRRQPAAVDGPSFEVAQEALLTGRRFSATYKPRGNRPRKVSRYEVSPLGLVVRASVIYLVATLFDYPEPRQLAMHRLSKATLLDKSANRPVGFDLDGYIASQEFDYPLGKSMQLQVRFEPEAARHLEETPLTAGQRLIRERDGRVRLVATVPNTAQLRWWLLGFGAQVEVLKPASLRQEFQQTAQSLAKLYRKRGHG